MVETQRRHVRQVSIAVAVFVGSWFALMCVLWLSSDGEPVCEGPLITQTDDSFPPQCNTLLDGVQTYVPGLLLGVLLIAVVGLVAAPFRRGR